MLRWAEAVVTELERKQETAIKTAKKIIKMRARERVKREREERKRDVNKTKKCKFKKSSFDR